MLTHGDSYTYSNVSIKFKVFVHFPPQLSFLPNQNTFFPVSIVNSKDRQTLIFMRSGANMDHWDSVLLKDTSISWMLAVTGSWNLASGSWMVCLLTTKAAYLMGPSDSEGSSMLSMLCLWDPSWPAVALSCVTLSCYKRENSLVLRNAPARLWLTWYSLLPLEKLPTYKEMNKYRENHLMLVKY